MHRYIEIYKLAIAEPLLETNKLEMNKWKIKTIPSLQIKNEKMVKIVEGVRNGFFHILFPASVIEKLTVQNRVHNVSLNLNPGLVH